MVDSDPDVKYDRSLLGVDHDIGVFEVTKRMIISFAKSTGETAPQYVNEEEAQHTNIGGLIAPPTFCNMFVDGATRPDIKLEFGDVGLFAGQSIENLVPVRPGDTLSAKTCLKGVYAKTGRSGKMVFAVWKTTFVNQLGNIVALVEESFVRRNRRSI